MNLNNVTPIYSKVSHAIVLLDSNPCDLKSERRIVHQEVMDALVQYFIHEQPPYCVQKINSMGKCYVLMMTPCKE